MKLIQYFSLEFVKRKDSSEIPESDSKKVAQEKRPYYSHENDCEIVLLSPSGLVADGSGRVDALASTVLTQLDVFPDLEEIVMARQSMCMNI